MHVWAAAKLSVSLPLLWAVSVGCSGCEDPERAGIAARPGPVELRPREGSGPALSPVLQTTAGSAQAVEGLKPNPVDLPDAATETFEFLPPEPPDQQLACDAKGFVHLTRQGFRAFRNHDFKRVTDVRLPELSNVVMLAGHTHLLLGEKGVYRYYFGQKKPRAFARVPQLGPSEIWPNPQNIDQFWLRYARDDALHLFTLDPESSLEERRLDEELGLTPRTIGVNLGEPRSLPGFSSGPFTFLGDGEALYVVGRQLRRLGTSATRDIASPIEGRIVHLLPGPRLDRYFALNEAGLVSLLEWSRGHPQRAAFQLGGLPYSVAVSGNVLAAVVLKQGQGKPRAWFLQVYRGQKRLTSWALRDEIGLHGNWVDRVTANRDLCLFPHKPWVLLGGRDGVVVYDYREGEPLFSTLPE